MKSFSHLSNGEFRIMQAIWSSDQEMTQALVMKTVNRTLEKPLNVSTIATYLRRIIKKGYLEKINRGDGHPIYQPVISYEEYFQRTSAEFLRRYSTSSFLKTAAAYIAKLPEEQKVKFLQELESQKN